MSRYGDLYIPEREAISNACGQLSLFTESSTPVHQQPKITPEWYGLVEEFLGESDALYPGIIDWWRKRVVPEINSGKRLCKLVAVDGEVAALAIAKVHRRSSKLCTLRVAPQFRRMGIGQQLLKSTLASLICAQSSKVHFTISEEIFDECGDFFTPYGFRLGHWRKGWYVRGMYEMAYWARASAIRDALSHQLPLFGAKPVVVLSIRPKHAEAIEQGAKLVEFRRRFSSRARAANALFYVTSPVREFRLSASIADVIQDAPASLWDRFGAFAGCEKSEFDSYFEGTDSGYALALTHVQQLSRPVSYNAPELRAANFHPPQSFAIHGHTDPLIQAVVGQ